MGSKKPRGEDDPKKYPPGMVAKFRNLLLKWPDEEGGRAFTPLHPSPCKGGLLRRKIPARGIT